MMLGSEDVGNSMEGEGSEVPDGLHSGIRPSVLEVFFSPLVLYTFKVCLSFSAHILLLLFLFKSSDCIALLTFPIVFFICSIVSLMHDF